MSKSSLPNTPLVTILFALPFAGAGALIMLVAADIIQVDPSNIHAPRWVLGAAGFTFFIAGIWVLFQGFAGSSAEEVDFGKWVNYAFGLVFLIAFSAIFIWVGLGSGAQDTASSDLGGRCIFGGAGLLMGVITLWYAISRPMQILGYLPKKSQTETKQDE